MLFVYLMINGNGCEWEDMVIFLTEEEAIQASIKYPNSRIEIFCKNIDSTEYLPTYNYYKNGDCYKLCNK